MLAQEILSTPSAEAFFVHWQETLSTTSKILGCFRWRLSEKGKKQIESDRGYKEFVEKQYLSHGGFWQLRILIFSMVGVAAAIAEMLVNSKDHRMYHKLSFLLRIGV